MSRVILLAVATAASLSLAGADYAFAAAKPIAPECGDTIGPGGVWELTGDVGPCGDDTRPVLTIIGPVRVDMAGHSVRCEGPHPLGLDIAGRRARIRNGTIVDCRNGIRIGGAGRHRIYGVHVELRGAGRVAYAILSDRNLIVDSVASCDDEGLGFEVRGHNNRLRDNEVNGDFSCEGTFVYGNSNVLKRNSIRAPNFGLGLWGNGNRAHENASVTRYGAALSLGGERNRATKNEVGANNRSSVSVSGNRNVLARNHIWVGDEYPGVVVSGENHLLRRNELSGEFGFRIDGRGHTLKENIASTEFFGYFIGGVGQSLYRNRSLPDGWMRREHTGFRVAGDGSHVLTRNLFEAQYGSGFVVEEGSQGNLLTNNDASGDQSSTDPEYVGVSLQDDTPGCGTNRWTGNRYWTRNQSCVGG